MSKRCNKVIQQGKRKGKKCGNPCKRGSDKCMHHDKFNKAYKNKYYLSTKYINLKRRIIKLINENKIMISDIDIEREYIQKLINGIDVYLGKDVKFEKDEYIQHTNSNKHNAEHRRETLVKRKKNLKHEKEQLEHMINTLKEARSVLKKNSY